MSRSLATSPRMLFSADGCGCDNRNRVTAPVMMPCCWPRRRRRVQAIAWPISAPVSAPPALRWPAASPASISCWSRSMRRSLALARDNAAPNGIAAAVIALDVATAPRLYSSRSCAGQCRSRADEPAVQRCRAASRLAGLARASIAHVAAAATLESWIHAARRILKPGGTLTLIWRADGIAEVLAALDRGFGSLEILPVHGDATAPAIVFWFAPRRAAGRRRILPALMLNDESGGPIKRCRRFWRGRGVCRSRDHYRAADGC